MEKLKDSSPKLLMGGNTTIVKYEYNVFMISDSKNLYSKISLI